MRARIARREVEGLQVALYGIVRKAKEQPGGSLCRKGPRQIWVEGQGSLGLGEALLRATREVPDKTQEHMRVCIVRRMGQRPR